MHVSKMPGRFFFMPTLVQYTSSAPASSNRSIAKPMTSPVQSSRLQESSRISSVGASISPSIARTQFAAGKSFVPIP